MSQPECPECDKLIAVSKDSQIIGEFLDWLKNTKDIVFTTWGSAQEEAVQEALGTQNDRELPLIVYTSTETFLAEFFNIDMNLVEKERRALLKYLRENQ